MRTKIVSSSLNLVMNTFETINFNDKIKCEENMFNKFQREN
jgi:hypothetical protein